MAQYMIDISLPTEPDEEFFALVPHQRAHIDKLLEQGVVMGYSLSVDRSRLWIVLNARDEQDAERDPLGVPDVQIFRADDPPPDVPQHRRDGIQQGVHELTAVALIHSQARRHGCRRLRS